MAAYAGRRRADEPRTAGAGVVGTHRRLCGTLRPGGDRGTPRRGRETRQGPRPAVRTDGGLQSHRDAARGHGAVRACHPPGGGWGRRGRSVHLPGERRPGGSGEGPDRAGRPVAGADGARPGALCGSEERARAGAAVEAPASGGDGSGHGLREIGVLAGLRADAAGEGSRRGGPPGCGAGTHRHHGTGKDAPADTARDRPGCPAGHSKDPHTADRRLRPGGSKGAGPARGQAGRAARGRPALGARGQHGGSGPRAG